MGKIIKDSNGKVLMNSNGGAYEVTAAIDSNITAGNIKKDVEILGVTGTLEVPVEAPENDVNFYDYDGFRVASYTIAEAKALTALPTPPTHEGLTFQEWNWTLADIQGYNRRYIDVGANYATNDAKCHIKVNIPTDNCGFSIIIRQTVTRSTTIEWGDGSENSIVTTSNDTIAGIVSHTYTTSGDYNIKIYKTDGTGNFSLHTTASFVSYVSEINASSEIRALDLTALNALVSTPKELTSCLPTFRYAILPSLTIPRGGDWSTTSNYGFYSFLERVCFPKVHSATSPYYYSPLCEKLIIPDLPSGGTVSNTCYCCTSVSQLLSIPANLQFGASLANGNYFSIQAALKEIIIEQGWTPNYNVTFSASTNYTAESLVDFFNKLGTTTNAITLTFGTTNLNKLTAEEKAIATNKGYTLA